MKPNARRSLLAEIMKEDMKINSTFVRSENFWFGELRDLVGPKVFVPDKCTVYLRSSFIGSASLSLEKNVKTAVKNCISFLCTRVVHVTKPMLSPATEDLLPAVQKSSIIFGYKCHCDIR